MNLSAFGLGQTYSRWNPTIPDSFGSSFLKTGTRMSSATILFTSESTG